MKAVRVRESMRPKVVCHDGTCCQCTGEGTVITIEANPLPVSLCPTCLVAMIDGRKRRGAMGRLHLPYARRTLTAGSGQHFLGGFGGPDTLFAGERLQEQRS